MENGCKHRSFSSHTPNCNGYLENIAKQGLQRIIAAFHHEFMIMTKIKIKIVCVLTEYMTGISLVVELRLHALRSFSKIKDDAADKMAMKKL